MNCRYLSLGIALLLAISGCERDAGTLRLVAPSGPLDQEIAAELAELLAADTNVNLQVTDEPQSGEAALEMLANKQADLALVSNYLPYRNGIATVMPIYPSVLHIAYRETRPAENAVSLIEGARIYAGEEGSASRLMFERIARRVGLQPTDFEYVVSGHDASSPPDLAVVFAPVSPQLRADLEGYRLFSLGRPQDIGTGSIVDAAALLNPPLRPYVIPVSTYGDANPTPVVTVAVDKILVARDDLNASIVYDLIGELQRRQPALAARRPGVFDELDQDFDSGRSTFVLHAGALNYLQRDEPTVYERYSGVAEVVVTLMIGLISATFAIYRILKIRRKNRIDDFYSAAIRIRDTLAEDARAAERARVVDQIRALQDRAFTELVDEKLAADESFRIFITLSNDILRQAKGE